MKHDNITDIATYPRGGFNELHRTVMANNVAIVLNNQAMVAWRHFKKVPTSCRMPPLRSSR